MDAPAPVGLFDPQHPLAHLGKKILIGLILSGLVVFYYVERYAKASQVLHTFLGVTPWLIAAMLLAEIAYLVLQGGLLKGVYRTVGYRRGLDYLTAMYTGMNLVNTVAPVAGLSGSIYMMHFEKQRGLSRSDTFLINFLYYLTDYLVFLAILLVGLTYLLLTGQITHVIILTSLVFAGFCLAILLGGAFLFSHPNALQRSVTWINRLLGRALFRKRPLISADNVLRFSEGTREAWARSRGSLRHLLSSVGCAFGLHLSSLALLGFAFLAIHIPINLQILVAGYTVATLLNIVSPTPGGIGVAEGGMTAVFSALGVPVEQALVVSLLYRTAFTWFPLVLGLLALHVLPRLADKQPAGSVY